MPKNNKTCITCGKKYSYCPGCGRSDVDNMWKNIYCSENCRNIFNLMTSYCAGHVSKEKAIETLSACDLSGKEHFKPSLAKKIDEVMAINESVAIEELSSVDAKTQPVEVLKEEDDSLEKKEEVIEASTIEKTANNAALNYVKKDSERKRYFKKKK